jgi:hypothetical protein
MYNRHVFYQFVYIENNTKGQQVYQVAAKRKEDSSLLGH